MDHDIWYFIILWHTSKAQNKNLCQEGENTDDISDIPPPSKKKAIAFSKQKVNCKYNFVDFCIFLSQIILSNYCIKCNYDNCL